MTMIAGIILAGGEGRRMGGADKPLLPLTGITLLDHIVSRLRPQLDRLALSANGDPARYVRFGLKLLADAEPGLGPLSGILVGLDWAAAQGCATLLSVPGDTPFVPRDLVARLLPAASVAMSGGRIHHAVALWPVSCRAALHAYLHNAGKRSVRGFAETLPARVVAFATDPIDPFFNINTQEDLSRAEVIASSSPARLAG